MPPKLMLKQSLLAPPATPAPIGVVTPVSVTPRLVWLYGPSGSGKTYYHRTHYPDAFIKSPDCNWVGYKNQDVVVIEDFELSSRKVFQHQLYQWLTSDYISVYVKRYKKRPCVPKIFVVTSYYHPLDFKHLKPFIKAFLSNCLILRQTYSAPVLITRASRIVAPSHSDEDDGSDHCSSCDSSAEEDIADPSDEDKPLTQPDPVDIDDEELINDS